MSESRIQLTREERKTPLGFTIKGGTDKEYKEAKFDQYGIYVAKIVQDGLASKSELQMGDQIVSVNDISLIDVPHAAAVAALRSTTMEVDLQVRRVADPFVPLSDSGFFESKELKDNNSVEATDADQKVNSKISSFKDIIPNLAESTWEWETYLKIAIPTVAVISLTIFIGRRLSN